MYIIIIIIKCAYCVEHNYAEPLFKCAYCVEHTLNRCSNVHIVSVAKYTALIRQLRNCNL